MRLFIALPLPESVERKLLDDSSEIRRRLTGVKWVGPGQLHVTLQFLGEVGEEMAETIVAELARPELVRPAFDLGYRGLHQFPERGAPRVLVVRLVEGAEICVEYQERLLGILRGLGLTPDPRFTPHITLGRVRRASGPDRRSRAASFVLRGDELEGSFTVSRCVLFQSTLTPGGPIYQEVSAIEFPQESGE